MYPIIQKMKEESLAKFIYGSPPRLRATRMIHHTLRYLAPVSELACKGVPESRQPKRGFQKYYPAKMMNTYRCSFEHFDRAGKDCIFKSVQAAVRQSGNPSSRLSLSVPCPPLHCGSATLRRTSLCYNLQLSNGERVNSTGDWICGGGEERLWSYLRLDLWQRRRWKNLWYRRRRRLVLRLAGGEN